MMYNEFGELVKACGYRFYWMAQEQQSLMAIILLLIVSVFVLIFWWNMEDSSIGRYEMKDDGYEVGEFIDE